jgi:hypothetical protein
MDGDTRFALQRIEAAIREAAALARKAHDEAERIKQRALIDGFVIKGDKGETGEKGERGEPGPPGELGPPGRDGTAGVPGLDGLPGRDGKDGKDGKTGPPGKNGRDGKDAPARRFAATVTFDPANETSASPIFIADVRCAVRAVEAFSTGGGTAQILVGKRGGAWHVWRMTLGMTVSRETRIDAPDYAPGDICEVSLVKPPGEGAVFVQVEFERTG